MMIIPATDFQLIALSGLPGRRENYWYLFTNLDYTIVTHLWFPVISSCSLFQLLLNHQKALLQWLIYPQTDFKFIP